MAFVRRGGARSSFALRALVLGVAFALVTLTGARASFAAAPHADAGADAAADAAPTALDQAKALFRSGVAMFDAGDFERALDFFVRSREAYPSALNSENVAICLDKLGRFDESLEMYETTLATYTAELDASDRAAIGSATAVLRTKVASVEVTASTNGTVLIDGRERGKLPLSTPIRVLAGKHVVRVVKDGYATFEAPIEPGPGDHVSVDAKLQPLAAAGELRVEDPAAKDGQELRVFVDAVDVGKAPWEGTLGPGAHVVWSHAASGGTGDTRDVGSAPTAVTVLQGQTALLRLKSGPLGPATRIETDPPTASITVGGVPVGTGVFELRLPSGSYEIDAREPGYFPGSAKASVVAGPGEPSKIALKLAIDPNDPRWPKPVVHEEPPLGHFWLGAFGGPALGATMGSAAEASCPAHCTNDSSVLGPLAGLRAGFRLRMGVSIELSGAYFGATQSIARTRTAVFPSGAPAYTVTYALSDQIQLRGPLAALGLSDRFMVLPWLGLVPRATVGVLLGQVRDPVTGTASGGGQSAPVQIAGAGDAQSATRVVVAPEIGVVVPWKSLEVGAALGLMFLPGSGPSFTDATMQVAPSCTAANPGAVGCAPSSSLLANERALGSFFLWVPQVNVAYVF